MLPEVSCSCPSTMESVTSSSSRECAAADPEVLELVAVLDRCTDATRNILERFGDSRIRLLDGPQPGGLVRSLNLGLAQCRAPLVARLDADDVCEPERLAMQKQVLDARAVLVAVGSGAILIDADSRVIGAAPWCVAPDGSGGGSSGGAL